MKINNTRIFIIIIILSIIYLTISANSAFEIENSSKLISAYKNNNLIRLHVIANSNSPEDQFIKRKIRTEIIDYMNKNSRKTFKKELHIPELKKQITKYLNNKNISYSGKVKYGNYYFPKRTYGDITLPAGKYKALKIILGKGNGSNWWCVLFPPLCVQSKVKKTNKSKLEFRFKIAELINFKQLKELKLLKP